MTTFGYTLMTEEHGPRELVDQRPAGRGARVRLPRDLRPLPPVGPAAGARRPTRGRCSGRWLPRPSGCGLMTMVTCPIIRYHPAVVAQKAATTAVLSDGRFTLGVGTGERLNEHVVGEGWPAGVVRHEMLAEAIEIIRACGRAGTSTTGAGTSRSRTPGSSTCPTGRCRSRWPPAARSRPALAARLGDGLVATEPDADLVDEFRQAHEGTGSTWNQIPVCWGDDADKALERAHHSFRWSALGWKVQAELPNPINFDAASAQVRPEDLRASIPTGPDLAALPRRRREGGRRRLRQHRVPADRRGPGGLLPLLAGGSGAGPPRPGVDARDERPPPPGPAGPAVARTAARQRIHDQHVPRPVPLPGRVTVVVASRDRRESWRARCRGMRRR